MGNGVIDFYHLALYIGIGGFGGSQNCSYFMQCNVYILWYLLFFSIWESHEINVHFISGNDI